MPLISGGTRAFAKPLSGQGPDPVPGAWLELCFHPHSWLKVC